MVGRLEVLRGQFHLTWARAEYHLARVTTASLLWEPVASCWTVRRDAAGVAELGQLTMLHAAARRDPVAHLGDGE